jgi:nickel/cobalt exporter
MTSLEATRLTFAAHIAGNVSRVPVRWPARAILALALGLLLIAAVLAAPTPAHAHPLGNFSVNHVTTVRISDDEVRLRYLLDQAEIPTVQERDRSPREVLERKRAEVLQGLELTVDGKPVALAVDGEARVSFPPGSGGLPTSRFEFRLTASVDSPRSVRLRDDTFEDRVGWRAIVAAPGEGTAVRTDAPSGDPTGGLRRYPDDLLSSPLDRREASFSVTPGDGTLVAPRAEGGDQVASGPREEDGFAGLFERAAAGEGVLLLLLLAAFGWGALHALSPGHGKAMVAAYLVGTRGTARHALALGATVTVTHTAGVFALGFVTLALSQYLVPEALYPWLSLASGLLVLGVGGAVLRSCVRRRRHHHHHHAPPDRVTARGLVAMGAAAGLIPCPSALVVLLAAVAQQQIPLGLVLIVAFSAGLAATLTALGLAVVFASRFALTRAPAAGRLIAAAPTVSALMIVGVGCALTAGALPQIG